MQEKSGDWANSTAGARPGTAQLLECPTIRCITVGHGTRCLYHVCFQRPSTGSVVWYAKHSPDGHMCTLKFQTLLKIHIWYFLNRFLGFFHSALGIWTSWQTQHLDMIPGAPDSDKGPNLYSSTSVWSRQPLINHYPQWLSHNGNVRMGKGDFQCSSQHSLKLPLKLLCENPPEIQWKLLSGNTYPTKVMCAQLIGNMWPWFCRNAQVFPPKSVPIN